MSTRNVLLPVLLALATAAGSGRAQDALPASVQASFFLKVLSYDRALSRRGGSEVVVAVMYDAASASSSAARAEFVRAVRGAETGMVGGRPVRLVEINVAAGQVTAALQASSAVAAYVTAGMQERIPAVVEAARTSRVITFGGSEAYARRGVAVAVDAPSGKTQLFVNLAAARSCGADLPATLLRLATVIS